MAESISLRSLFQKRIYVNPDNVESVEAFDDPGCDADLKGKTVVYFASGRKAFVEGSVDEVDEKIFYAKK